MLRIKILLHSFRLIGGDTTFLCNFSNFSYNSIYHLPVHWIIKLCENSDFMLCLFLNKLLEKFMYIFHTKSRNSNDNRRH